MKKFLIAGLLAALGAVLFVSAADTNFPIYFPNSKLIVKAEVLNRTVYLPLKEIVQHMGVPYTDAIALETLTMRSGSNRLVVTKNSALISYNDQILLLPSPILREDNRWLAPVEFLSMGLTKLTGTEFRYRSGTSRVFAGNIEAPELEMNAQTLGPITRLTIRSAVPITIDAKREDATKAILRIDHTPLDPTRERFDHRDRLLHSVAFDDSDGDSKIILDLTREVSDLRVTPADNNHIFFIDLLRASEPLSAAPPAAEPPVAAKPDAASTERKVRVVVIDPGHGGMDTGAKTISIAEKDLTLTLARKLRAVLQSRLGTTVLLTRDSDTALDNEARSAVANNNQANLFISLHAGYSPNPSEAGSSVFIMKEDFGDGVAPASAPRDQLFLPWYLGYRTHRQASAAAASIIEQELNKGIPAWKFTVRSAPLAVLSSATMPSLILEIGNLNNPTSAQALVDSGFQTKLVNTIADAVQKFSESPQAAN
ncbi:MAG TPA: N-acetylmuramoyl-L-alanine amidase [Terriglobia bacterium]|nr:N-acetylmuramoyl-L-alanine amidase [Terriglobia bacterium]